MNKMIIVEGPQGTGKTTLTNYLRDNISGSNLYRLSGQKDKTLKGLESSKKMYYALLDYLKVMESIPMDLIFDRTFFTEEIYSLLGYKEYDFTDTYNELIGRLCSLDYEIYLIILYLKNPEIYKVRLDREKHHNYQSFSIQNSQNQQNEYLKIAEELKNTKINVVTLAMDDFDASYQKINKILHIK
jgi:thymidylate kinase